MERKEPVLFWEIDTRLTIRQQLSKKRAAVFLELQQLDHSIKINEEAIKRLEYARWHPDPAA